MAIDISNRLSQSDFGSLVGVSRQSIGEMVSRGILDPTEPGEKMLIAYCSHLREMAAGRLASGDLDLATERAGLAKAQRERVEMLNAEKRGELAPTMLIEQALAKAASSVAGIFDAIPGLIRRRHPEVSMEVLVLISAEIVRVRNTVANISIHDVFGDEVTVSSISDSREGKEERRADA